MHTLGPTYNEQTYAEETARGKWILVVTELFSVASMIMIQKNISRTQ